MDERISTACLQTQFQKQASELSPQAKPSNQALCWEEGVTVGPF